MFGYPYVITCLAEKLCISDTKLINKIIVPKVSVYWHVILFYLGYDIAFKKNLEKKYNNDPQQCCTALFENWITSSRGIGPKTYSKLLNVLNQFPETSNYTAEIKQCLKKQGITGKCTFIDTFSFKLYLYHGSM